MAKFKVNPDYIELFKDDILTLQFIGIEKDDILSGSPSDPTVVEFNAETKELRGLKDGYAEVHFNLKRKNLDGSETNQQAKTSVVVEAVDAEQYPSIMLHNRNTNRMTTLTNYNTDVDIQLTLPNVNDKLLVDTQMEELSAIISRPKIYNVQFNNESNFNRELEATPYNINSGELKYEHTSSTWQFATDEKFINVVKTITHSTGDLTKCGYELAGANVYVRVRYSSNKENSQWSRPVFIGTVMDTPADTFSQPVKGDNQYGAYYGVIKRTDLVDNYDYRGNYVTLFNNNLKTFKQWWQVSHEGKLYYAVTNITADNIVTPGTSEVIWKEDKRENLPTYSLFIDQVGIGLGNKDKNLDGYSTAQESLSPLINNAAGSWFKFVYQNRVMYVADQILTEKICWNDVAKRDCVYGDRTIRYGSRLYKIRMLNEEEYKVLLGLAEADLNILNFSSGKELLEDFQEGANRKIAVNVDGKIKFQTVDPKNRECAYRPVLELIPKGSEPWRHPSFSAQAENEELQYDPYTDTGYFGFVPAVRLFSGDEMKNTNTLFTSNNINSDCGWLKFYWHGQVLFITKKSINYNRTYKELNDIHYLHPVDLGSNNKTIMEKDGIKYIIGSMGATRAQPYDFTKYIKDKDWDSSTGNAFSATNIELDAGKYSQWQELMYRVQSGYVGDEAQDKVEWEKYGSGYKPWHGGVQKGDNWAHYENKNDLNLTAGVYGGGVINREYTAYKNDEGRFTNTGQFGAGGWDGLAMKLTYKDNETGWRPMLKVIHHGGGKINKSKVETYVTANGLLYDNVQDSWAFTMGYQHQDGDRWYGAILVYDRDGGCWITCRQCVRQIPGLYHYLKDLPPYPQGLYLGADITTVGTLQWYYNAQTQFGGNLTNRRIYWISTGKTSGDGSGEILGSMCPHIPGKFWKHMIVKLPNINMLDYVPVEKIPKDK